MKTHGRIIFSVVQILVVVSSVAFAADGEIGKLALVNGEVRISKDAVKADSGRIAKPGDSIVNTDVIKTNDNASAKILFTDQSVIDVGPNAALKVSDYALKDGDNRTGTFSLLYGKMRALVTKKVGPQGRVEVRSGQTVMGVRGTEFMVDTPKGGGGQTTLVVASGTVAVTPPGATSPISVGAGQMMSSGPRGSGAGAATTTAAAGSKNSKDSKGSGSSATASATASSAGGSSSQVTQVSSEQMQSLVSSSKAADNTFQSSVKIDTSSSSGGNSSSNSPTLIAGAPLPPPPPPPPPAPPAAPGPAARLDTGFPAPIPGQLVHLSVSVQ